MIDKRSKYLLDKLFRLSYIFRSTALKWDDKSLILSVEYPVTDFQCFKVKRLGYWLMILLISINVIFGGCRIYYSIYFGSIKFQDAMFNGIIFFIYNIGFVVAVINVLRSEEVAKGYSLFRQLEKYCVENYEDVPVADNTFLLLSFFICIFIYAVPGIIINYIVNAHQPVYLGSLQYYIPQEYHSIRLVLFNAFLIIEILSICYILSAAVTCATTFLIVIKCGTFWIEQITTFDPKLKFENGKLVLVNVCKPTRKEIRAEPKVFIMYKLWFYCITFINDAGHYGITGQHFVATILNIFCLYSTVKFFNVDKFKSFDTLFAYVAFPVCSFGMTVWIIVIQPQIAYLLKATVDFLECFIRNGNVCKRSSLNYMYIKSLRPIRTPIGPFSWYKKSTMPQVINEVINITITLLLSS